MAGSTWEFDEAFPVLEHDPATGAQAVELLAHGNAQFANIDPSADQPYVMRVGSDDLGFGAAPGIAPKQAPFAALLGCADARVPLELLFLQSANDLFVVRVAGNVLGAECVGSLDYAIEHLSSVRLIGVVGHTGCGAVSAAADAYLDPTTYLGVSANLPLRAIVDAVMPTVRAADEALRFAHGAGTSDRAGFHAALVDTAVVINAAVAADAIRTMFAPNLGESLSVAYGVYDLASRQVGLPTVGGDDPRWTPGMVAPPVDDDFPTFVAELVRTPYVRSLLDTHPGPNLHHIPESGVR
ncbi:MAG: hypothetical protein RLZ55_105 [Actinomycetota bacterium]|jgi:carbonic anhydrase